MAGRQALIKRETKETNIRLELDLDGSGQSEISSGVRMLDHLLEQIARHGVFDITASVTADDIHHLVEDTAICLGKAFNEALGEKGGIVRTADSSVPMDDALATVIVDIGGRGYSVLDLEFNNNDMNGFPTDLVRHFLETLAMEAKINLHAHIAYGSNDHHRTEALFKALGRAMDKATRIDERKVGNIPSTKETL